MSKIAINLKPIAGFCIKSSTLHSSVYTPQNLPESRNGPIAIQNGFKIFINIAWDANVPPPPAGSEEAIQSAMQGQHVDEFNPDGWYVPILVSEGRLDEDKAGNPSLVFDCVYHTSVKHRTLVDPKFKIFIIELALQRLEVQTSLALSRQIGTPNISSKGKLLPRTVFIPSFLTNRSPFTSGTESGASALTKPIIQEVRSSNDVSSAEATRKPKGILKTGPSQSTSATLSAYNSRPTWKWTEENDRLWITIYVPRLTRTVIAQTTLDLEPRRLILNIPDHPPLDINLYLSDAEIVSNATPVVSTSPHGSANETAVQTNNTLTLKRQRDLDVDGATAEWRMAEGVLVVVV